jgi:hypothetical protein
VFPVRYGLHFYVLFRRNSAFRGLSTLRSGLILRILHFFRGDSRFYLPVYCAPESERIVCESQCEEQVQLARKQEQRIKAGSVEALCSASAVIRQMEVSLSESET